MKKFIFVFTALPLLSFADIYSGDALLNDIHNSCNSSSSCIDTFNKYFKMLKDKSVIQNL